MILAFMAAAVATVTPATAQQAIETAQQGAVIKLAPGSYGRVMIVRKTWSRPITIDASGASLTLNIVASRGVNIRGGTFTGALGQGGEGYAVLVRQSSNVAFENVAISSSIRGMVIDRSTDVRVTRAMLTDMRIDGVNIASSQRVTITDSSCSAFNTGEAHPDCIQMWSSPKYGVTQDVTLLRNRSDGNMQGFTAFNHVRDGVDDGGFDRITIADSWARGQYAWGVAVFDCRNCVIRNNRGETPAGARHAVVVRATRCTNCTVTGNVDGRRPR